MTNDMCVRPLAPASGFCETTVVQPPLSSLFVTPAGSDAQVQTACDIMVEAADWLAATGRPLWNRKSLTSSLIRPQQDMGNVYLASLDGTPVGAFVLLFEDPALWPDVSPGQAFYIHKLAVRRSVAGTGASRAMVEHAVQEARFASRAFLRLDCAMRPKLCAFYESAGFTHHSDWKLGDYFLRRYQRLTKS